MFELKDTKQQVLFDTLLAVARDELLLSPKVITKVVGQSGGVTTPTPKLLVDEIALTDREQEVLIGAARPNLTPRIVKAHFASTYNKFGVGSRAVSSQRGLLPVIYSLLTDH